jgi:EmrB/QacA subfamily drug resistance transporter
VGCQFVIILDVSIVNVALPSIQRSFHIPAGGLQDIVTAYAVAFGGPLIFGGRIADLIGRRTVFRAALVGFGLTSLLCGFATSTGILIAARALQGLSAAFLAPSALGLLTATFNEGADRVHALSRFGAATMLGALSGLVVGGTLVTIAGWRSVFFVNVPITIAMTVAAGRLLPPDRTRRRRGQSALSLLRTLDVAGAILVTAGLSSIVFALNLGSLDGWSSTGFISLSGLGVVLLGAFIVVELRSRRPLLRFELFKIDTVRAGNSLIFVFGLVGGASSLILGLYFQEVRHFTPLQAGLAMVPQGIIGYGVSRLSVRVFRRFGLRQALCASYAASAVFMFALSTLLSTTQTYLVLLPVFILIGASQVISTIGSTIATSLGVPSEELGLAGAMRQTSFQVGFSLGVAVFASLAATRTHQLVADGVSALSALDGGYRLVIAGLAIVNLLGSVIALVTLRSQGAPRAQLAPSEALAFRAGGAE